MIKRTLKRILYIAGSFKFPKEIRILFYHSIDDSGSVISTSLASFKRQMAYLRDEGYHTISLSDFVNNTFHENTATKKLVVITFDDGFENNYLCAFPILKKYGFTATIFLPTDYINGSARWISRDLSLIEDRIFHSSISEAEVQKLNKMSDLPILTWEEINEMSDYGIDFGVHTGRHLWLRDVTLEKAGEDIYQSRAIIEERLNKRVISFSYPYGDFTPEMKQLVKELEFLLACSGDSGSNSSNKDLYDLKRIGPSSPNDLFEFKFIFSAGFDWYIGLRAKLKRLTHANQQTKSG